VSFDFHWADNIQQDDSIIEFAINGDSAPNQRFDYRYETTSTAISSVNPTTPRDGSHFTV